MKIRISDEHFDHIFTKKIFFSITDERILRA